MSNTESLDTGEHHPVLIDFVPGVERVGVTNNTPNSTNSADWPADLGPATVRSGTGVPLVSPPSTKK